MLTESVVWLCAKNRVAEAEKIIHVAAKVNHITLPAKILAQPAETVDSNGVKTENYGEDDDEGCTSLDKLRNSRNMKSKKSKDTGARYTMLDIFRNRHLTINALCMAFCWSVGPYY